MSVLMLATGLASSTNRVPTELPPVTVVTKRATDAGNLAVATGPGRVTSLYFEDAGASTPTWKLWDNTAASGTVLIDTTATLTTGTILYPGWHFDTGLTLTTAGGTAPKIVVTVEMD